MDDSLRSLIDRLSETHYLSEDEYCELIDNRTPEEIKHLVTLVPKHIITEASGGITLQSINTFKGCGVNYISSGSITNGAKPLDISFNSTEAIKK